MKALVLLGLLGVSAEHAKDWHPELGIGQSSYHTYGDGIWYQVGSPHVLKTKGDLYLLGITGSVNDQWDWHIDYVNLGKSSSRCLCTADENYDAGKHIVLNHAYGAPPAQYNGSGFVQGIMAKATYWGYQEHIWIGADMGVMAYKNTWTENVYHWSSVEYPDLVNGTYKGSGKIRPAVVTGISMKTGRLTVSADVIWMKPEQPNVHMPLWRNSSMVYMTVEL